ncbi:MAG: pantoate--beta-alanine ligase [Bacteroidaceae bacterium]|nr:pantoate--beta-alanine ligase [Bacteroidaceae bacterium]
MFFAHFSDLLALLFHYFNIYALFCTRLTERLFRIVKQISTIAELRSELKQCREQGKTIGLVPTMGALHEGHASLVRRSVAENDVTVVSIFLNPTQFNDKTDLAKYPRTLEADCRLLDECGATIAFAPSVDEIYPEPDTRQFSYPPTDSVMEGAFRPGHFNGVCQIVSKLFMMTEPDRAYFGEKDFQQIAVIRRMVDDLGFRLQIVPCPVVREESGLAMSSRNTLLTPEERATAANIYRTLRDSRQWMNRLTVSEVHDRVVAEINAVEGLEVQYYRIVDGRSLADVGSWDESEDIVGCITVYCGSQPIRLIDHIRYKG